MKRLDPLTHRVLRRAHITDIKTVFQEVHWADPARFAAMAYCLKKGEGSSEDYRGDQIDEILKDQEIADMREAKEEYDELKISAPKASELKLRAIVEFVKKYKSNLSKIDSFDKEFLVKAAKATAAFVRYMRAFYASRMVENRNQAAKEARIDFENAIARTRESLYEKNPGIRPDEVDLRLPDAIENDEDAMGAWIEFEILKVTARSLIFASINAPAIPREDAELLLPLDKLEAIIDEARDEMVGKNFLYYRPGTVSAVHWEALHKAALAARNSALYNMTARVKAGLNRKVPALLLYVAFKGK
jgi:hypothetical protein